MQSIQGEEVEGVFIATKVFDFLPPPCCAAKIVGNLKTLEAGIAARSVVLAIGDVVVTGIRDIRKGLFK